MGLWTEAINAAVYIIHLNHPVTLNNISPYQVLADFFNWDLKMLNVGNLRVCGCKAFVLANDLRRSKKLDRRALIGKLFGFKAYII